MAELSDQGLDESVIRAVTATMYIGETNRQGYARDAHLRHHDSRGGFREHITLPLMPKLNYER